MDTASLCVLMLGIFALFIIILSRFIVDYQDINNMNISNKQDTDITNKPIHHIDDIHIDMDIDDDPVIQRYDPIVGDNDDKKEEQEEGEEEDVNNIKNELLLINSVNWMDIKGGQIIKIKNIEDMNKMNNHGIKAKIDEIHLEKMNI